MNYKAVIFDLDGTLFDTIDDIADAMNDALSRLGFPPHGVEKYKYFVGDGVEDLASRSLPAHKRDEHMIKTAVTMMREAYGKCWANKTKVYEGVTELLDELIRRGIIIAVLTNKPDDFAKMMVSELLPQYHFSVVRGSVPNVHRKPHPSGALEITKILGLSPEECMFLGDTDVDMITAVSAGMYPVGALWGFRKAEELLESGAKILVSSPLDLLQLL
jgi:phosphoglycolate phosphatase